MYTKVRLDRNQERVVEEAVTSVMSFAPFFAYFLYDQMELYPTRDVKTLATDGKRVFFNPDYLGSLKPMERCFAICHEVYHAIYRHPTRMKYYHTEGTLAGLPWINDLFNIAADYVINADLVDNGIGTCNPAWLYDPQIKGTELAEEVYAKLYKKLPPPPPPPPGGEEECENGGPGGGGTTGSPKPPTTKTYGQSTGRTTGHDKTAQAAGGRFDEVLEPQRDTVTGKEDLPSDMEFREAVNRAEAVAKRAGKLPGNLQRLVREIVEPQIYWKDELRLRIVGRVGNRREDWNHPNRRRLVLNPFVYMPGRQGHGAELITVVIDTSGSIGDDQLKVFFSETASILNDCRPKRVQVIWCDAHVQRVEEARSLDELLHIREAPGGGGTSFRPPFAHLEREKIVPDTLIYFTDMCPGDGWPDEPDYPVIWCSISKGIPAPFGDLVEVKA